MTGSASSSCKRRGFLLALQGASYGLAADLLLDGRQLGPLCKMGRCRCRRRCRRAQADRTRFFQVRLWRLPALCLFMQSRLWAVG